MNPTKYAPIIAFCKERLEQNVRDEQREKYAGCPFIAERYESAAREDQMIIQLCEGLERQEQLWEKAAKDVPQPPGIAPDFDVCSICNAPIETVNGVWVHSGISNDEPHFAQVKETKEKP